MKGKLRYGNTIIPYDIIQTKRKKTLQIFVEKDRVEIRAPESKTLSEITQLLQNRVRWIFNSQLKLKNRKVNIGQTKNSFLYLGKDIPYVVYTLKEDNKIMLKNNTFQVFTTSKSITAIRIKKMYHDWLLLKYIPHIEKRIEFFSEMLNVKPRGVKIKNLKSKWGSATVSNTIHLNLHLLKVPRKIIDYVIVHELIHLKIQGHGYEFWSYLQKFMPDYEKRKTWLDQNYVEILRN